MFSKAERNLLLELYDKEYAESYADTFLNGYLATQIKVIREQRKMTHEDLARKLGISTDELDRIEDVDYEFWTIELLKNIAKIFDVRFKLSFETYSSLLTEEANFNRRSLERQTRQTDLALTLDRLSEPKRSSARSSPYGGSIDDLETWKKALGGGNLAYQPTNVLSGNTPIFQQPIATMGIAQCR